LCAIIPSQFDHVFELLEAGMPRSGTVRIRCSHCPRIFCEVSEEDYLRVPQARPPLKIIRAAPWQEPPELSPEILAWFPPGTRILETVPGRGGRLRFICHPVKCGADYPLSFDRWTQAIEAALDAGWTEQLLGRGNL
jgi:hypothetical protein